MPKILHTLPRCTRCGKQATLETVETFIMRDNKFYCFDCFQKIDKQLRQKFVAKLKAKKPETPTVSQRAEEKEKLWYPIFRLKENPFRYFECALESDIDGIPLLPTVMANKIESFINGKISAIIQGSRGCGKSALIESIESDEDTYPIITPKNMDDVYDQIFMHTDFELAGNAVKQLWAPKGYPIKTWDGEKEICTYCPTHCHISLRGALGGYEGLVNEYAFKLRFAPRPCPAKKKIVMQLLQESLMEKIFLMDVPDNLDREGLRDLVELSNLILGSLNILILFATPEQAALLKKTDTFRRLPFIDFQLPNKTFFMDLFKQRIDGFREDEAPYPFQDQVVEKLAELSSHVPRDFIQLCNLTLVQMWVRSMKEPCNLSFLDVLDIKPTVPISEQDIFLQILEQHKGQWVGIQQLTEELSNQIGAPFTERKIGAILTKLGFTMRKLDATGKAQVLITPLTLEALKKQSPEPSESSES